MFDHVVRHPVEVRTREDMLSYGISGVGGGTMGRGMPLSDPRLCTPTHRAQQQQQYYMSTLERNAGMNGQQPYYQDDVDADSAGEDERHQPHPQSVHMMNYMNDLDAAMTRPIAYPQYDQDDYPPQQQQQQQQPLPPHLMAMMLANGAEDPYNHVQNFEHVMHRKETHDRRVEDELWQGTGVDGQEQYFASQSQLAGPEYGRQGTGTATGTRGRTRRKKGNNNNGGHYTMGGGGVSYNVHGGGEFPMEGRLRNGDEPIYEEIMSGSGGARHNPSSRHLSAFLNEKSNSVISCLEPIK